MKYLLLLTCFVRIMCSAQEDTVARALYNPQFEAYLNELRLACIAKDTAKLHTLIGDRGFGWSCYGGAMSQKYQNDWDIFRERFDLIEQAEQSNFWELFLRFSDNGFYYDGYSYTIPAVHDWGKNFVYGSPASPAALVGRDAFLEEKVQLRVGETPESGERQWFTPQKQTEQYPYIFVPYDAVWLECFADGQSIGFVSAKDVYDGYLYFEFAEDEHGFQLRFFETCP